MTPQSLAVICYLAGLPHVPGMLHTVAGTNVVVHILTIKSPMYMHIMIPVICSSRPVAPLAANAEVLGYILA